MQFMKLYYMEMDVVKSWNEIIKSYTFQVWPKFEELKFEVFSQDFWLECLLQVWWWLKKQTLLSQIVISVLSILGLFFLVTSFYVKLTKGVCKSKARLDGKTVLITGANSGIGFETARDLANRGARVILAVRNLQKGIEAAQNIIKTTGNHNLMVRKLDLSSLNNVRNFASEIHQSEARLDILILNAGIALTQKYLTEDNLELHMATNHFGHFLLTNLLLPLMCQTSMLKNRTSLDPVRIICVSSIAHWYGKIELENLNCEKYFRGAFIYNDTKLANLLFTFELARKLSYEGFKNITVNAVHPGPVNTGLFRHIPYYGWLITLAFSIFYYSPLDGAQTSIYCSVSEDVADITGKYFAGCKFANCSPLSQDKELARKLWFKSIEIVELLPQETVVWI